MAIKKLKSEVGRSTTCTAVAMTSQFETDQPRYGGEPCSRSSMTSSPRRSLDVDDNLRPFYVTSGCFERHSRSTAFDENKRPQTSICSVKEDIVRGGTLRRKLAPLGLSNDVTNCDLADISRITTASSKFGGSERFAELSSSTTTSLPSSPSSKLNSTFDYPLHSTRRPEVAFAEPSLLAAGPRDQQRFTFAEVAPVRTGDRSIVERRDCASTSSANDITMRSERRRTLTSIVRSTLFAGQLRELLGGSSTGEDDVVGKSGRRASVRSSARIARRPTTMRSRDYASRAPDLSRLRDSNAEATTTSSKPVFPSACDDHVVRKEHEIFVRSARPTFDQIARRCRPADVGRRSRPEAVAVMCDSINVVSRSTRSRALAEKIQKRSEVLGDRLKRLRTGSLVRQIGSARLVPGIPTSPPSKLLRTGLDRRGNRRAAEVNGMKQGRLDADRKRRIQEFRRRLVNRQGGVTSTEVSGLKFMGFV